MRWSESDLLVTRNGNAAVPEDAEGDARDGEPPPGTGGPDDVDVQHTDDHHHLHQGVGVRMHSKCGHIRMY